MIPKPKKISRTVVPSDNPSCLAGQMRLYRSPVQRNIYCELVEGIAKLHDEYNGEITGCTSPRWQEFVKVALDRHDFLRSYQDEWPVMAIVRIHRNFMYKRKDGANRGKGLSEWTKHKSLTGRGSTQRRQQSPRSTGGVSVNETTSVASGPTQSWASECRTGSETSSQQPIQAPMLARSTTDEHLTARRNGTRTSQDPGTPPPPACDHISDSTSFSRVRESLTISPQNATLLGFLRALTPDLSHLLPIFVDMGVADDAALQGLARMGSRDQWVYSWVKENLITELEFSAIVAGFKKIHYIPPVSTQLSAGRSM